jgi:YVTN family beta-propeller protein
VGSFLTTLLAKKRIDSCRRSSTTEVACLEILRSKRGPMDRKLHAARNGKSVSKLALGMLLRTSLGLTLLILCFTLRTSAQNTITTVAGGGGLTNGPAISAVLPFPFALARDSSGNIFIISAETSAAYRLDSKGQLTVVAGNGLQLYLGDGGPATEASMNDLSAIAVDVSGNLFLAQDGESAIRRVDAKTGTITTVAGNGTDGFDGDGGPATEAELGNPQGVVVDAAGNILIADTSNNRIRRVNSVTGFISTIAGNGTAGFGGDGGLASAAVLNTPQGLTLDATGNLFFVDTGNYRIRRVDAKTGIITTVAGNGGRGFSGNGGPATDATFNFIGNGVPPQVALDAAGDLFIADQFNQQIRRVDAKTGIITTVAGILAEGYGGDGGLATNAELSDPSGILVDPSGNLYIGDNDNNRVRFVAATTGIISTIAGNGGLGDGESATTAALYYPQGVAAAGGNIWIADSNNTLIRLVNPAGVMSTVSGQDYIFSYAGDGGPAIHATLNYPVGVTADASRNLFIADANNNVIRRIDASSGMITTVAGNGVAGFTGDGGPATKASMNFPSAVAGDTVGNGFISDSNNQRIRRVDIISGVITTVAGNGTTGFSGDGGPAVDASLNLPAPYSGAGGVVIDTAGNLFISDTNNHRIRRVDSITGVITTVAGSSSFCASGKVGDGGPATGASLCFPEGLAVDPSGNLFIADTFGDRVRRLDSASGTIATVAGNGLVGFSGDGGPATAASLTTPRDVALDNTGNLYIADANSQRIRAVHLTPAAIFTGHFTSFGPQVLRSTSPAQSLTLGNTGGQSLVFTSATATGDFSASNDCGAQVAPATSCAIRVVFTPTVIGVRSGTLTITTNDPTNPSQTFSLEGTAIAAATETLNVTRNGTGAGTITSAPSGINCGTTCSAVFTSGTVVVLVATETSGSTFSGWSGACTNVSGTCSVTMNETQAVTATFTATSSSGSPGPFAYVPIFGTGNVSVFDVTTNLQVATIPVGGGPVDAAVSPNGSFVYVTSFGGGYVSVISAATNTVVATIPVGPLPFGLTVTPDSSAVYVAVGGTGANYISVINAATNSVVTTVPVGVSPGFVTVTPDGKYLYVSNGPADVTVINVATNTVVTTIPVGASPQSSAITPDGSKVYVVCPGSGVVSVINTASNSVVQSIPVSNGPYGISITPDGTTAFVGEINGAATAVINLATNTVVATIPVGTSPRGSAITPDGAAVWQSNLNSTFVSVISTASDAVTTSVPVGGSAYDVAIGPGAPTTQTITQPLSPTAPNQFNFGAHSFTAQYPAGTSFSGVNMTVAAVEISQAAFARRVASTTFSAARCLVYTGAGGNCVDYEVTCTNSSGASITCPSEATPTIAVKTSFGTTQLVTNPGFLTTPIGTNAWQNIFSGFELARIDPTMKGRTSGFSEFVAVDLGATNPEGAATFQFEAPLLPSDSRSFTSGTTVPVQFQLTSVAHAGVPVTDATAGISMLMVADAHGNPVSNVVLEQAAAFAYQTSTQSYVYSLNTFGYAAGVYNITVYGNAFAAQQVQITLLPAVVSEVLTVAKTGSGSGTVTSSPAGINCGATCTAGYPAGTVVTLTATEAAGSTFSGWSGACTNAAGSCSVTMSASESATATFSTVSTKPSAGPFAYVGSATSPSCCTLAVLDTSTNLVVATIPIGGLSYPFGITPDQTHIYVAVGSAVDVIDTATNSLVGTITGVGPEANSVTIAPNGLFGYVANGSTSADSVSVFSTTTNRVVATVPTGFPVGNVSVTPNGAFAYASGTGSTIAIINTSTNTVESTFSIPVPPGGFNGNSAPVFNSSGSLGYVAQDVASVTPGTVTVISIPSNATVATIQVGTQPEDMVITPDGTYAYVSNRGSSTVSVIDTSNNTVIATVPVGIQPNSIAITPDGAFAYVANLTSNTLSVIQTSTNSVVATIPITAPFGSVIPSAQPTSQSITQPLSPTAPNPFNFGPHAFTVQYPAGTSFSGVTMTVTAVQITQAAFKKRVATTTFSNATCLVYLGAGGNCVDYEVTCANSSGASITCPSEATPTIAVKTGFSTAQSITNPGFLTTPIGTNAWQNIFTEFELQQVDPTMKGRTTGFSEFVAVDLGATNAQGLGQLQFQAPLLASEPRSFVTGTVIPVQFQLTSVAHPGKPVTDASAGISVVMLTDANGNAVNTVVLEQTTAFAYQSATQNYQYSLNTSGYAAGTYGLTVFGDAFVAQQVQFTLTSTPVINLVTTLQSLTLNTATNQYVALLSVSNAGNATANSVTIAAAGLNGTATATKLPLSMGNVVPGTSVAATVVFPASAGAPGSHGELTISETYTGGSAGSGLRVTLP